MLALLFAVLSPLACHNIQADQISGRDLAATVPALSQLAPETHIGLAPFPGHQRTFSVLELKRIALANHLDAEISEPVCFAWAVSVPDREKIVFAMKKTLQGRGPQIQIVESSLAAVPDGEFVFPLTGLGFGSDGPAFWRGYVRYAENHRIAVWARVVVTVREQHVISVADLHPGDIVGLGQVKIESYQGPIRREKYLTDVSQAIAMLVCRPIQSGSVLLEDMLQAPLDVERGDTVNAVVQTGAARLEVQAVAEDAGRRGQIITVRNPRSGRSFHARVQDKGVVAVVPGGQYGLVVEARKS